MFSEIQLFTIVTLIAFLLLIGGSYLFARRFLPPFAWAFFMIMILLEALLAGLYLWSLGDMPEFWKWFFNIHAELNAGAMFSAAQLMMVSLAAIINGSFLRATQLSQRVFWWLLAVVFLFLSLDEYFSIHEEMVGLDNFRLPYLIAGIILAGAFVLLGWIGFRRERMLMGMLVAGLGFVGGSGLLFEPILWRWGCSLVGNLCPNMLVYGETLESFGATLVLGGVMAYAERHLERGGLLRVSTALATGGLLWFGGLVANTWILPSVEARLVATAARADYADGKIALIGYRISPQTLRDNSTVEVSLYWETQEMLTTNYIISAHLLRQPGLDSVAQDDWVSSSELNVYPTVDWLPHIPVKTVLTLTVPEDLPRPVSYQLIARLWQGDDGNILPITQTDLPLLTADTVILNSVPVLPVEPPATPTVASDLQFAGSLTLYGYALPAEVTAGEAFKIGFWWQKNNPYQGNPSQFVHITNPNATPIGYDKQPFAGSFPVLDWPVMVKLVDEWDITLPVDTPPGAYEIYTGLYEWPALTRLTITGPDKQPIPNDEVHLGTITVK